MRNKINITKTIYFGVNICFLVLLLLPYWNVISPFQFSDGIPMLSRVNDLKNSGCTVPSYLFKAHGNSIHALVYMLVFLDDVLCGQSMLLLKLGVFFGMFGTGLLIAKVFWQEQSNWINLFLALICNILTVGTYNFDLYIPFQVVLSLSRFIFIFMLYELAKQLMREDSDNKVWFFLIGLSIVVALSHGMGMMFAGAVFYMHVATRQKKTIVAISATPFLVYNILQIYFNSGYGEVTTSKLFLIKHFREFLVGLFAYYGGSLYQFFGVPRMVSIIIGGIVFLVVAGILLYFFLRGIWGDKIPGNYILGSAHELLAVSLLGMSFLASVGASSFVTARIDLVESIANDPVGVILETGRYLCFSIVPYLIIIYLILKIIKRDNKLQKSLVMVGTFCFFLFCVYKDIIISQRTVESNNQLDANAVALLSGMDYYSEEMERAYGDFANDWYWGEKIPKVYEQLKIDEKYIWKGLPSMESSLKNFDELETIRPSRIDYHQTSDPNFVGVQLKCSNMPKLRYLAVTDELGNVVGYVYKYQSRGFFIRNGHLYYDGNYYLKGYVEADYKDSEKLYVLNQTISTPTSIKGRVCVGNLQLADLTDANWVNGVALDQCCLLVEYTDEKLDLIENATLVGDGFRTIYDIDSYDCVDGWIRIFITGNDSVSDLRYPNTV